MLQSTKKPIRVLVVDDNRAAATSLSFLLTDAGFEVETSFDGVAALEVAGRFRPDACVLDINMPGMSGYELARRLRDRVPDHLPILATVTGLGDYDHLDRAAEAGFDLHFTKPADPCEVACQLRDCVQKSTSVTAASGNLGAAPGPNEKPLPRHFLSRLIRRWLWT